MEKIIVEEGGMLRIPENLAAAMSLRTGDALFCRAENEILYLAPEKKLDPACSLPHWSRSFTRCALVRSPCTAMGRR